MTTGRDAARAVLATHAALPAGVLVGEGVGHAGLCTGIKGSLLVTPLSESAAVGTAVGLALAGKRPIVELLDANGLSRAVEALAEAVSLADRSAGGFSAPVVVLAPLPVQAELPRLPAGIRRYLVGSAGDLGPSLEAALSAASPAVVLYGRDALDGVVAPGVAGVSGVVCEGSGVVVIAEGDGVAVAEQAGTSASVVDLRGSRDPAEIARWIAPTGRVVFCTHEASDSFSAAINAAFWRLEAPPAYLHPHQGPAALAAAVAASASA